MSKSKMMEFIIRMSGILSPSVAEASKSATAHLSSVQEKSDEVAKKHAKLQKALQDRQSVKSWNNFSKSASNACKAVTGVKDEVLSTISAVAKIGAIGAGAGASIYAIAKSSANFADAAIKNAQAVDMQVEAFTALQYAAEMSGVSQQDFITGTSRLHKMIGDALGGSQEAITAFARAGIDSLYDETGKLKNVQQLYEEIASKLASMDDAGKSDLVQAILGKSGPKWIAFFNTGKDGIQAMIEDAKRLGITLTEAEARNAEAFNDSFANIGKAFRGVSLKIGKHFWVPFTKIHQFLDTKIVAVGKELEKVMPAWAAEFEKGWSEIEPLLNDGWNWLKGIGKELDESAQKMGGWITMLKDAINWEWLKKTGTEAFKTVKTLGNQIDRVAQSFGGWLPMIGKAVKLWMVWRGIRLAKSIWDAGKAVKDLGKKFLDLESGGVSVRAFLGNLFKGADKIPKEGIKPFSSRLRESIVKAFKSAAGVAWGGIKGIGGVIKRGGAGVYGAAKGVGRGIAAGFSASAPFIQSSIKGMGGLIRRGFQASLGAGKAIGRGAAGLAQSVIQGLPSALGAAKNFAVELGRSTAGALAGFGRSMLSGAKSVAAFAWQTGVAGVRGLASFATSAAGAAARGMASFAASLASGAKASWALLQSLAMTAGAGIKGLAVSIAAKAVPMLAGLSAALSAGAASSWAFAAALLANPITWVVASVVALGAAVYFCVKHWDAITDAMSTAWEWVKGVFVAGWNMFPGWIQAPLTEIAGYVSGFGAKIWSGMLKDWERIKDGFKSVFSFLGGLAATAWEGIAGIFSKAWDVIAGIFSSKFTAIGGAFENSFIGGLLETVKQFSPLGFFIDAFNAVKDWILKFDLSSAGAELAKKLGDGILKAWDGIKEGLKSAVVEWIPGGESIVKAAGVVSSAAGGAYDTVAGWFGGGANAAAAAASIPAFANGGMVDKPTLALVGEAGPEIIVPLTKAARARELMSQAAQAVGFGRERGQRGGKAANSGLSVFDSLARFNRNSSLREILSSVSATTNNVAAFTRERVAQALPPAVSNIIFGGARSTANSDSRRYAESNSVLRQVQNFLTLVGGARVGGDSTASSADNRRYSHVGGVQSWLANTARVFNGGAQSSAYADNRPPASNRNSQSWLANIASVFTSSTANSSAFRAGDRVTSGIDGRQYQAGQQAHSWLTSIRNIFAGDSQATTAADNRRYDNRQNSASWLSNAARYFTGGDQTANTSSSTDNRQYAGGARNWLSNLVNNSRAASSVQAFTAGNVANTASSTNSLASFLGGDVANTVISARNMAALTGGSTANTWNSIAGAKSIYTAFGDVLGGNGSFSQLSGDVLASIINNVTHAGRWFDKTILQQIPAYADGGIVTAPQLALIGEAGPEAIIPLNREGRSQDLMSRAAGLMGWSGDDGAGGGNTFEITFAPKITIQVAAGEEGAGKRIADDFMSQVRQIMDQEFRNRARYESRTMDG